MGGITILAFAWTQPIPLSEKILATCVGSMGLFGVLIRALLLRSALAETSIGKAQAQVEIKKKSY
jgi:hypothetical protein